MLNFIKGEIKIVQANKLTILYQNGTNECFLSCEDRDNIQKYANTQARLSGTTVKNIKGFPEAYREKKAKEKAPQM